MRKILLSLVLSGFCLIGFGTTFTIVSAGTFPHFVFSPATVTITHGDDVLFTIASIHTVIEVDKAVWDANGTTPLAGGFNLLLSGSVSAAQLTVGTHYYICGPHAGEGMKGQIIVQSLAGIDDHKTQNDFMVYPNPAKNNISIQFDNTTPNAVEIKLFNLQGKLVKELLLKTEVSGLFLRTFSLKEVTSLGVYFVQILSGEKNTFHKVVIM